MSSVKVHLPQDDGRNDRGLCNPSVAGVLAVRAGPSVLEPPLVMASGRDGGKGSNPQSGTLPGKHPTNCVGCGSGGLRQKRQPAELLVKYGIGWLFRDVDAVEVAQTGQGCRQVAGGNPLATAIGQRQPENT